MTTFKRGRDFTVSNYNKIAVIKALRQVSGLGLKEAKDAVEQAADGIASEFSAPVSANKNWDELQTIKNNGFIITQDSDSANIVLESIKQNVIFSTKNGNNDLARLLLNFLDDYEQIQKDRENEIIAESEARQQRDHAEKVRQIEREKMRYDRELVREQTQYQAEIHRLRKREYETRIQNNLDGRK